MNFECALTCGHASRQHPHVIHRENRYANSCVLGAILGPAPRSYVPSIGIHACAFLSASNIFDRSTHKSRITGNFDIGSTVTGPSSLSASCEQPCRTRPLITIVHEPQTSSRQLASNTTGATRLPWRVTGLRRISISIEMML